MEEPFFALPRFRLKGYPEPLPVFRYVEADRRKTQAKQAIVGRSAELQSVVEKFRAVRPDETQVLMIEGEPGIGKSTLLAEALDHALSCGLKPLRGEASAIA